MSEVKIEPKLITHLSKKEVGEDIHIVREVLHHPDGKKERNIRIIKDFKRPFWVTKPIYRNYDEKKESEELDKVDKFKSTESDLLKNIVPRLGDRYMGLTDLRRVKDSPYLYGIDVDSRTILKKIYMEKYKDLMSVYEVAAFDIEADIKTGKILVMSISTKKSVDVFILKEWVAKYANIESRLRKLYDKYIPDVETKKNAKLNIHVINGEVNLIKKAFNLANNLNVDFMAAWNIDYDINKIVERLEKHNVKPEEVFHYHKIPKKYAYFKYKPGRRVKKTEAGREIPLNPEEIWNTVKATSNFYFIDAMSAHRFIRVGGKSVPGGYKLNNILKYEKIHAKLKFNTDGVNDGPEWHNYMVRYKPLEYIIYNVWDTMSMIELDNKTKDLQVSLPLLSGVSHFDIFDSGPKKLVDNLFFFYLQNGRVLGVRGNNVKNDKILGLDSWIVTLPSYRIDDNGLIVLEEDDHLRTTIRKYVFDADAVSSYPSNTMAANVSRDTTHRELIAIMGYDKNFFKTQNINLIFGKTNAMEYCRNMFNMPSVFDILEKEKGA